MKQYYQDDHATIYHADCREIIPDLDFTFAFTSPPYNMHLRVNHKRNGFVSRGTATSSGVISKKYDAYTDDLPMGDYFEEVTEDWPEWKKQAYVDQLEEYLFEMGKLNPDYVSSSVMHPSQLYKGSLYDVKPELDILDVFDK